MNTRRCAMKERWRRIRGYPGYAVSNHGRVASRKSGKWRLLKPRRSGGCYLSVVIYCGGKKFNRSIHKLVLEAFVGPCTEGMECRHFPDNDGTNNYLINLQWGSKVENERDKKFNGTSGDTLTDEEKDIIRRWYGKRERGG